MKTVGDYVNAILVCKERWRRQQILAEAPPHLRPEIERLVKQLWPRPLSSWGAAFQLDKVAPTNGKNPSLVYCQECGCPARDGKPGCDCGI